MKAWERFVAALEKELPPEVVKKWIGALRVEKFDAANLYLRAENPMVVAWFEEHIRPRLKGFLNENHRPVRVHLQKGEGRAVLQEAEAPKFTGVALDPACTLEHFVRGTGNAVAAEQIAEWVQTGRSAFNPLFLYGPKGSGKTHLLMSAAHALQARGFRALYVTADAFTDHVVQAIRAGRMQEFRRTYRDLDALLVDDVHKLAGRSATQEEFFHTFNTLHTLPKPVVLSAPVAPTKLEEIEPRLISRFEWGLALKVEPVEPIELLRSKAAVWHVPMNDELATWLIRSFPSGVVAPLQALALRAQGAAPLAVEAAAKVLGDLLAKEAATTRTLSDVVKAVSAHFGVRPEDLLGKSQTRECVLPRQVAMYVARLELKMSFQAIGKAFGRDHSTVITSVKAVERMVSEKSAALLGVLS